MTRPKPCNEWQAATLPANLPLHMRRNIGPGEGGCWLWLRSLNRHGYGWASMNNRTYEAHRLVWLLLNGTPDEGKVIDHLCRVRHCVNPDHMEVVTNRVNILRGVGCNRPACPQGHEWTPENTYINKVGAKNCRQCGRDRVRRYKQQRRAAA